MEIFLDGVWGRIDYDGATDYDTRVVCRQLGYNTYSTTYMAACYSLGASSIRGLEVSMVLVICVINEMSQSSCMLVLQV